MYPYAPYFKNLPPIPELIPPITRHIPHITGSVSINLKCVPYSETPNFDPDHTPYRSPLSPTEVTESATVRLILILSALLCSVNNADLKTETWLLYCLRLRSRSPHNAQHSTSIIVSQVYQSTCTCTCTNWFI